MVLQIILREKIFLIIEMSKNNEIEKDVENSDEADVSTTLSFTYVEIANEVSTPSLNRNTFFT